MNDFIPGEECVVQGLSAEAYRAAPGVSQSMLKAFAAEPTPKHFQEMLTRPRPVTADMEFGTILHTALLQPELLKDAYDLQPDTYPSEVKTKKGEEKQWIQKPWNGNAEWCKEWKRNRGNLTTIDRKKEATIAPIVATVMDLPVVGDILRFGQKEVSFFKRDEETGLLLKCRVDAIATDTDGTTHIVDPKKVQRGFADAEKFKIECSKRGYDIQCASYLAITGATRFIFVAMEDAAPFEAETFVMDDEFTIQGLVKWRKILKRYAEAIAEGVIHGYKRSIKKLSPPSWNKDRDKLEPEDVYI